MQPFIKPGNNRNRPFGSFVVRFACSDAHSCVRRGIASRDEIRKELVLLFIAMGYELITHSLYIGDKSAAHTLAAAG
jgi:hypothetical protein